jgi:hypothetical protein
MYLRDFTGYGSRAVSAKRENHISELLVIIGVSL